MTVVPADILEFAPVEVTIGFEPPALHHQIFGPFAPGEEPALRSDLADYASVRGAAVVERRFGMNWRTIDLWTLDDRLPSPAAGWTLDKAEDSSEYLYQARLQWRETGEIYSAELSRESIERPSVDDSALAAVEATMDEVRRDPKKFVKAGVENIKQGAGTVVDVAAAPIEAAADATANVAKSLFEGIEKPFVLLAVVAAAYFMWR